MQIAVYALFKGVIGQYLRGEPFPVFSSVGHLYAFNPLFAIKEFLVDEISEIPLEGALLPETYQYSRGGTRQSVVDRMRDDRDRVIAEIWDRRADDLPISTVEELVVLASIVEKETALADERSRVAAVFINRMRSKMPLQSDPTVIYALFGGEGKVADENGWSKQVSWIGKKDFVTRKAVIYDLKGNLYKTLTASNVKEIDTKKHRFRALHMKIVNEQNKRRSELIIDKIKLRTQIPDKYFTTRFLERI